MHWSEFLNGVSLSAFITAGSELLNNNSVSAFIGAFSAFMLVVFNDRRRDLRTVKTIKSEIRLNRELAKGKLEALKNSYSALVEKKSILSVPLIRFSADPIRRLAPRVLHLFSPDQLRALDALCYAMEATDSLLHQTRSMAEKLRRKPAGEERDAISKNLLTLYDDGISTLGRTLEMCDFYLAGEYRTIIRKYYHIEECI